MSKNNNNFFRNFPNVAGEGQPAKDEYFYYNNLKVKLQEKVKKLEEVKNKIKRNYYSIKIKSRQDDLKYKNKLKKIDNTIFITQSLIKEANTIKKKQLNKQISNFVTSGFVNPSLLPPKGGTRKSKVRGKRKHTRKLK